MKKFLVSKNDILSEVAHWAVAQSPYHRPDNLEVVLDRLNDLLGEWKENLGYKEMSYVEIKQYLESILTIIPEFVAWNDRKNGNKNEFKFVTRYSKDDNPDDDFIDLDALFPCSGRLKSFYSATKRTSGGYSLTGILTR